MSNKIKILFTTQTQKKIQSLKNLFINSPQHTHTQKSASYESNTKSLTGVNQNIFWLKEMIYDANQNMIYAMVSENKVFNLDISLNPPFPYSSLEVEIQSGLYLPNVNMTGIIQYSPNFFKLVGMNNSDELHLFEKVIPYQSTGQCDVVSNGVVDSFEEHNYFMTPPAMNHVTVSPSPRICNFQAQYQGNIYIDCIY